MHDPAFFRELDMGDSLSNLFESLPNCLFFVKDRKYRMVAINDRLAEQIAVADKQSILGMTDHDYLPDYLADAYRKDDEAVLKGQTIADKVEMVARVGVTGADKDKVMVDWSTTTKVPIRNRKGTIVGILGVTRPYEHAGLAVREDHPLQPALRIMRRDFSKRIKVPDLAAKVSLSLSAFERSFKREFGLTPKAYLRHIRVQEACHRLVQSNHGLSAIAFDCGFADQSHLSREFVRLLGERPKDYRRRAQGN